MELTPQTLHAVEFREARRGGYNTRDVDDFIERVAGGVGQLNERVREAQARADAAEARLVEAQRELDEVRRRPAAPVPEVSETDETLRRTLVLAQRTADATIKEAKEEANRVLSEAREEAA
ncbi:MAG TPA: DivIVA domain-containing protein, partial [Acidimicrobiales bacterium]|nr:DivIVA domain-containing protein [Acidimicrobiales bacterium]